jgi:hypothetical protein
MRELFLLRRWLFPGPVRPWDVALWSGVTPHGSAACLKRLNGLGLVKVVRKARVRQATWYQLDWSYPFIDPLAQLFALEWRLSRRD